MYISKNSLSPSISYVVNGNGQTTFYLSYRGIFSGSSKPVLKIRIPSEMSSKVQILPSKTGLYELIENNLHLGLSIHRNLQKFDLYYTVDAASGVEFFLESEIYNATNPTESFPTESANTISVI